MVPVCAVRKSNEHVSNRGGDQPVPLPLRVKPSLRNAVDDDDREGRRSPDQCGRYIRGHRGSFFHGTRQKAEQALRHVMADIERGVWRPAQSEPAPEANPDPSFHEFASEWFEATKGEWRKNTQLDYEWQLVNHLLPFFRDHRLGQITTREIDRYRQAKVAEAQTIRAAAAEGKPFTDEYVDKRGRRHRWPRRALSAASINKTITRLGQILEVAVEYGLIEANPAKGRRRRLKTQKVVPVWLDCAEHIEALLDAADDLDD
jgi:hypothetical protein